MSYFKTKAQLVSCAYQAMREQRNEHTQAHTYTSSFNSQYCRTTWLSWFQNGKPFRILMQQEMVEVVVVVMHKKMEPQYVQSSSQITTNTLFTTGRTPFHAAQLTASKH